MSRPGGVRELLPRPTLSAILAMGAAAVLITLLATRDGSGTTPPPPQAAETSPPADATTTGGTASAFGPLALSATSLRTRVASLGQPVYWVGPEPGDRYELSRTANGNVFLRYLPAGVAAGGERELRTVGTYPLRGAYVATDAIAKEPGAVHRELTGGWLAVYRPARPTSIYLARKRLAYQIEIFDPSAAAARKLALSSRLRQVG